MSSNFQFKKLHFILNYPETFFSLSNNVKVHQERPSSESCGRVSNFDAGTVGDGEIGKFLKIQKLQIRF